MMPAAPHRFPDVTSADLRAIQRLTGQLTEACDLNTLGRELIQGAAKILPGDFMAWNQWTLSMDFLLELEMNHEHFRETIEQLNDELVANIHHHPVIAAGDFDQTKIKPQRLSDYQCDADFRANPLFQEVYRHLESHHQMAYNAIQLNASQIILSWNRQHRDFSAREVQLLHILGRHVEVLGRRLEDRQHMQSTWQALLNGLRPLTETTTADAIDGLLLAPHEGRILAGLICGETRIEIAASLHWRRDTLDRRLANLREMLGLENSAQLMQALAVLKAPQSTGKIR